MKEKDYRLVLTPFHPFTPRQAEIVELVANGASYKKVSQQLGISERTAIQIVSRCNSYDSVFDRIEQLTGERPQEKNWITPLIEDVLFFQDGNDR